MRQPKAFNMFIMVFCVTLLLKIFFAATIPLTGDEAYFIGWGRVLAGGYYDHPPLTGWIIHAFLYLGNSKLVFRLPTIISVCLIATGIYWVVSGFDKTKAAWIASLFLMAPINLCAMLMTTDISLILFAFYSGVFLFFAIKHADHWGYYSLSGVCLGLAFLSKYFAVLLALAYGVYYLCSNKSLKRSLGFGLMFILMLPFALQNLYWNYTHDWANILFNAYNRNQDAHLNVGDVLAYIAVLFYIMTPPIFYYVLKHAGKFYALKQALDLRVLLLASFVPLVLFFAMSFTKLVGLHWPLAFIPFLFILAGIALSELEIKRSIKFMLWFTGVHIIVALAALGLIYSPVTPHAFKLDSSKTLFALQHPGVAKALQPYSEQGFILATPSYSKSALLAADLNVPVIVFGSGGTHGREEDLNLNFRPLAHRNFAIFNTEAFNIKDYQPYFAHLEVKQFSYHHANFYVLKGYDFNFTAYQSLVLRQIYQQYWQVPDYLPRRGDFFYQEYFKSP